jgi:hypothetical protein
MLTRNRIAVAALSLMMMGADDSGCDNWGTDEGAPGAPPMSAPPFCPSDPPVLCAALCMYSQTGDCTVPLPTTPIITNCTGDGAGPRAAQFVDDINKLFECNENQYYGMSYATTPEWYSISPVVTSRTPADCLTPPDPPAQSNFLVYMGWADDP